MRCESTQCVDAVQVASLKQVQSRSQQAAAAQAGEALRLQQQLARLRQEVDEAEREAARARAAQERAVRLQVMRLGTACPLAGACSRTGDAWLSCTGARWAP